MTDQRHRALKDLLNSLRFLLNRQGFHIQQISTEQTLLLKSVEQRTTTHKKLEHVGQIRDYQLLLAENFRQLRIHLDKLQKFLDFNPDMSNTELYIQAGVVMGETQAILKQLDEGLANIAESDSKSSEPQKCN